MPLQIWASSHEGGEVPQWIGTEAPPADFAFCYSTRDLSATGVFLESDPPLEVGVELNVELALPGGAEPLRLRGRVVRSTVAPDADGGRQGMGVEFIDVDADSVRMLEAFVVGESDS